MTSAAARDVPHQASPEQSRSVLIRLSVSAVAGIWLAVLVISVFSPDLISGTQQDHVAIAAILTWIWGLVSTRSVVTTMVAQRGRPERLADIRFLVGAVLAIWLVAALVAVYGPVITTGTDPTHLPVGALLAPIAAMVLTTTSCQLFNSLQDDRHESAPAQRVDSRA